MLPEIIKDFQNTIAGLPGEAWFFLILALIAVPSCIVLIAKGGHGESLDTKDSGWGGAGSE